MSNETLKKLAGIFQEEFSFMRRADETDNDHKLGGEVWYEWVRFLSSVYVTEWHFDISYPVDHGQRIAFSCRGRKLTSFATTTGQLVPQIHWKTYYRNYRIGLTI